MKTIHLTSRRQPAELEDATAQTAEPVWPALADLADRLGDTLAATAV